MGCRKDVHQARLAVKEEKAGDWGHNGRHVAIPGVMVELEVAVKWEATYTSIEFKNSRSEKTGVCILNASVRSAQPGTTNIPITKHARHVSYLVM
jgi:hypothetical protein